jgi:outer membrane receptor protein involved in Fe transport
MRIVSILVAFLFAPAIAVSQPADPEPVEPPKDAPKDPPPAEPPKHTPPPLSDRELCLKRRGELSREAQKIPNLTERARLLRALPDCDASSPTTFPHLPAPTESRPNFAFEARLETSLFAVDDDVAISSTQPGIFFGHHARRFTLGVGFNFSRIARSMSMTGMFDTDAASSVIQIVPGARIVLARTEDTRTEAMAQLDVGYGLVITSSPSGSTDPGPSIRLLRFQLGPAIRHWITPTFAIGATAGLRYDRTSVNETTTVADMEVKTSTSVSLTNLFSSIQMMAVF